MTASTSEARTSPLATAGWVVFVLLVVYAVLIGGGWAGIYLVSLRTISLVLIAAGLGLWLLLSVRDPRWRPSTAIWPTLVLPVIALVLATGASAYPRLGIEYVLWAVLLVGLYLLLVRVLGTDTARARIGALAAMLSLVIGLLYMGTVFLAWIEWWELIGGFEMPPLRPLYASLSLGGPGTVQTVQVLLTVVAVSGLGVSGRRRQLLAAVLVAITAVVVVIAASRSGWIALAGATVITAGLWVVLAARSGSLRERMAERWAQRGVRITIVAAIIGAMGAALLVAPVLLNRMLNSGSGGREQYFTVARRMFEDAPVLGLGPGTWAVRRVAYTEPGELDHYIPHAHDIYLQTLAELGLVGAIAGLVALAPVAWLVWRSLRSDGADTRRWAWGALFALLFIGLFNVFDFQMNVPAVLFLAALPVAWLDASRRGGIGIGPVGERAAMWVGRLAVVGLWLGCVLALVGLMRFETVAADHQEAVDHIYAADWDAARGPADDAYSADSALVAHAITRGLVASADRDWSLAQETYRYAAETDDMSQSWLGFAQAQHANGAADGDIVESIERALRIGTQQPSIVFAAGHLYDRLGMIEQADELYVATLLRYPSLVTDPYWSRDPGTTARFEDIVRAAIEQNPQRGWEIALIAGDSDLALELSAPSTTTAAIIAAWQGDAEALATVYALADEAAENAYILSWASRLAARAGDEDQADRFQRLAVFEVIEGGELPGTEVRIDQDGYLEAVPAGTKVGFAGHYLYRRPLVPDLLPPGLPRLVFEPH
jgi:O-antigen ligase